MTYMILTALLCLALLLVRLRTSSSYRKDGVHSSRAELDEVTTRRRAEHDREIALIHLQGAIERRSVWLDNLAMALSAETWRSGAPEQPVPEATPPPTVTEVEREISAVNAEIDTYWPRLRPGAADETNGTWTP